MKRPSAPCGRNCEHRTITCKTDGTCPNGWEEYEKQMKEWRSLVNGNRSRYKDVECYGFERTIRIKEDKF